MLVVIGWGLWLGFNMGGVPCFLLDNLKLVTCKLLRFWIYGILNTQEVSISRPWTTRINFWTYVLKWSLLIHSWFNWYVPSMDYLNCNVQLIYSFFSWCGFKLDHFLNLLFLFSGVKPTNTLKNPDSDVAYHHQLLEMTIRSCS